MIATVSAADIASALRQHPPTAEQAAVIESPLRPLLVVAGAGSGKTETMAARVVWLVANGMVEPERVLGLTFTRKAAGELGERIRSRLVALDAAGLLPVVGGEAPGGVGGIGGPGGAGGADDVAVSTYHSYAAAVVADHGMRLAIEPGAALIGEGAAWQLASSIVSGWDDLGEVDAAPSTVTAALLSLAGECAEHLVRPEDVDAHLRALIERTCALPGKPAGPLRQALAVLAGRRQLLPLVAAYAQRKHDLGVLDHGDQVALAARLAAQVPDVAAIERTRWGVVLLDEYQDTSTAQAQLLRSLFGGGHPVTAVGDPRQSIYGWRGASAGGLEDFPRRFPTPSGHEAPVLGLSTSWRNDVAVLDAARAVAAPLAATSRVALPDLDARPAAGAGRVAVVWRESAAQEVSAVADQIAALWHRPAGAHEESAGPIGGRGGHRSMAVLCRARSQFRAMEAALAERDVPVEVVGIGGLLRRPEVLDLIAVLTTIADPTRADAPLRLLTGPRWRLGPRDLAGLAAWSRQLARAHGQAPAPAPSEFPSLVDAIDDLPPTGWVGDDGAALSAPARERLSDLAGVLRRLRAACGAPLPDLVVDAERALGLDVEVAARPGVLASAARADLDAFTDVAASFASSGLASGDLAVGGWGASGPGSEGGATSGTGPAVLGGFLAWLAAADAHERGLETGDREPLEADGAGEEGAAATSRAVQLLTIHAAKGLEWDVVAVPGLTSSSFPPSTRRSGGWLSGLGTLPYPLRGDAASLPVLAWPDAVDTADLEAMRRQFVADCAAHALTEERRLAYVALTRARERLLLSGSWWGATGSSAREPSPFLVEVVTHLRCLGYPIDELPAAPVEADNPALREPECAGWPGDPLGPHRAAIEAAAALVRAAKEAAVVDLDGVASASSAAGAVASPWDDEIDSLLAERAHRTSTAARVALPPHLSASRLVDLAADPGALALSIRRPVPVRPHEATRRGTLFHAWLEERFRAEALPGLGALHAGAGGPDDDPLELELDADAPADPTDDGGLDISALRAAFLASEWAERTPIAVEVDLETPLAGLVVRCRVDAVFARDDGGVDVVDWKTGAVPTGARARAAAVQLAVYRLGWSTLHGVPLERVGAAFFYAAEGITRRPVDLLDAASLQALVTQLPAAS